MGLPGQAGRRRTDAFRAPRLAASLEHPAEFDWERESGSCDTAGPNSPYLGPKEIVMTQADRTRILLVDDRLENLLAYQSILESLDLELVVAKSGGEALKAVLKQDFAVIL